MVLRGEMKEKQYMENNKSTIDKFIIENSHLRESLLEKEFALQEKDALLQKSTKLLQERERVIAKKDAEIQRHLSSFRYQAGTCFYDATHSLKAFLLLPLRLVKLFLRYKKSK